jgi:predicted transcriptional regulator
MLYPMVTSIYTIGNEWLSEVDNTNLYKIYFKVLYMASYRTSMQIVGDLLTATEQSGQDGIKTTTLLSKANLPHSRLSKFVSNLTGAGLINKLEFDGKHTFVITQRGRQYLETYEKFANVAQSFGLEL